MALISGGLYCLPPASTRASPFGPLTTLYGTIASSSLTSRSLRPMKRLIEKTVFAGLVTAWRLATVPTRRSPPCVKATTDGVVRPPSAFSMTVGSPPSRTAMHEFVVPRSIPMVFAMCVLLRYKILVCVTQIIAGRAHPQQRAFVALGAARVARPTAVAEQVDVELELVAGRRHGEHLVMHLDERRLLAEQAEAGADAADVGVDGHVALAVREQPHARSRLAADARQRGQEGLVAQVGAVERLRQRAQDRLDANRLDVRDAAGADRL